MHLSRIQIKNFRNFSDLDVTVSQHAVIVGENKIGKSNLIHALRLVLDPSLPDSARKLRSEDFWDGLKRPLDADNRILISVDISEFSDNANQLAMLGDHLVEHDPMVARLTYVWQPQAGLDASPKKDADYEFLIYGGDRSENHLSYRVRQRMPMDMMPALRDCESDLARWGRSPLRPLLYTAASEIDAEELAGLVEKIDEANAEISGISEIERVGQAIGTKLIEMVGKGQALKTALRYTPADSAKLVRALRIYIDSGRRAISDASLGSANVLYFALRALEYQQLIEEGDRDYTFLAIEEPEAHLHPILQRLIFRNYLGPRASVGTHPTPPQSSVLMTTHSPHIASVTPLSSFIHLKRDPATNSTTATSTASLEFDETDTQDLERYLDVNRGELLFAKGVILVEGDAERYLIPVLAEKLGFDLDELGISVCSIAGTNFAPYLMLIGPLGLDIPVAALTDMDPRAPAQNGAAKTPLGPKRLLNSMVWSVLDDETWEAHGEEELQQMASSLGMYINTHTLEVDLFISGYGQEMADTMDELASSGPMKVRMHDLSYDSTPLNNPFGNETKRFLKDIESVGKGRFAQRLASNISISDKTVCPPYILEGIQHVVDLCE